MSSRRGRGRNLMNSRCPKIRKLESKTLQEPRSHTNNSLVDSHLKLLIQGKFSDVTFIVGECEERIPCHQLFLKARSPVIEVMLSKRWGEDTAKEVSLEHVHPQTFKKFLLFIYTDTLKANVSEALEVLQLAHKYDVEPLVGRCEELLESKVTLDDAFDVFQAARVYGSQTLMNKVGNFWAKSMSKLQAHTTFGQLDKEILIFILKRNDLKIKEVDLFRLALQWARNQTDATVMESLRDILPLIRFPTMTLNEFTTAVVPTRVLAPSTVIELFTYFGNSDDKAKKLMARTLGFSTQQRQPNGGIDYATSSSEEEDVLKTADLSGDQGTARCDVT